MQSRYYDPEVGRFINADTLILTDYGFVGFNQFAYCINNLVRYHDVTGYIPEEDCINDDPEEQLFPDKDALGPAPVVGTTSHTPPSYNLGGAKGVGYAMKRGWTHEMIQQALSTPKAGISTNLANGANCDVHVYPGTTSYVVVETDSRNLVQLSKWGDESWLADRNIRWLGGGVQNGFTEVFK